MIFDVDNIALIFIAAAVVLTSLLHSIYSIGPTQVGLVRKRFGAKLPGDNPLAFRGEAGYQARNAHARPPLQVRPGVRRDEASLGAGARGADRRGDCPGWTAAAHRRKVGGVQTGVRQFHRPQHVHRKRRPKGRAEAGVVSRHTGSDSSRRIPGDHQAGGVRRTHFFRSQRAGSQERRSSRTRRSGSKNGNSKSPESLRIRPRPEESST